MKLSVVVSTQPASFSALAYQGQLEENLAKIKALGYDGVELAVRDPVLLPLDQLSYFLQDVDLSVPAIGTGQAFGEEGLSFTHRDEKIRRQAIERIKAQVNLANRLGAMVIIGLIRGQTMAKVGVEQTEQWLVEALTECASMNKRVKFVIEPLNRYETDLINTVESGLRFLERLRLENIGLLLDTFHMNVEEPSLVKSIEQAQDRLLHFHIADSNRWYPGAGHIDFKEIIATLNRIHYDGFLSAEILPIPNSNTAVEKTVECMRNLLV